MYRSSRSWLWFAFAVLMLAVVAWSASAAIADEAGGPPTAPTPNPLQSPPTNPVFAPVAGTNLKANGPAAGIRGDPVAGRVLFARNCTTCHGERGVGGLANPGSDDGTVPPLNPIDPGFLDASNGDPGRFTRAIDLFVQHGSRPAGKNPRLSMVGWGDHGLIPQKDLADIEAYVMQLNGMYWSDHFAPPAEVLMTATRSNGDVSYMTYRMTIINHGTGTLGSLTLRDALPPGLDVVTTYAGLVGTNPAKVTGNVVEWFNAGLPDGQAMGPFTIVAQIRDPNATVAPNTSTLLFNWLTWDGKRNTGTVTSNAPATATAPVNVLAAPAPPPPPAAATAPAPAARVQIVQPGPEALSWGFNPDSITVHVGDSVTWTNSGSLPHTVTADDGSFDSELLNTDQTWTHAFDTAGTFTYHCTPHPWMKATVVVQGSGS